MGALPKNKITRAERGKRRAGNTPTITKDPNKSAVPNAKRGFVAQLFRAVGLQSNVAQKQSRTKSRSTKSSSQSVQPTKNTATKAVKAGSDTAKVTRKTQHKG